MVVEYLITIKTLTIKKLRGNRQKFEIFFVKFQASFSLKIIKDVRDRSAIMECEVKFGAKILPAYSPLDMKVKQQLQSGENASLYVIK